MKIMPKDYLQITPIWKHIVNWEYELKISACLRASKFCISNFGFELNALNIKFYIFNFEFPITNFNIEF